ncbi:MAG: type IV pilin protein [Legionellales bacterium]|nr:type IV pilin protein [Legionellales bacterium]
MNKKVIGFTLIELMVTLVIIGILTAITYPSYQGYMQRDRRSDGQIALLDLANKMERYFTSNNTYAGATLTGVGELATSPSGYYNLSIATATATTYTLQAAPTGAQTSDTTCATLTLNQLGQKGATGTGTASTCWQ